MQLLGIQNHTSYMTRIEKEIAELFSEYPMLSAPLSIANKLIISGVLPIIDRNGTCWDTFSIRLEILNDYPLSLPTITEIDRKIPRNGQWHINSDDTCCVGTPAEQFSKLQGQLTILNWFRIFAIPFFANFIYRKDRGSYYNGEWSHGSKGILEHYSMLFKTSDSMHLLELLKYCIGLKKQSLNEACFCRSGKKYKRCYILQPEIHRQHIPRHVILKDIVDLQKIEKCYI